MAAALTYNYADLSGTYPDGDWYVLVSATSQRSPGVNRPSPRSYRLLTVTAGADTFPDPVDILAVYVAKFGKLIAGRKIFFKFAIAFRSDSLDGPHGIQSLPVEASVTVS